MVEEITTTEAEGGSQDYIPCRVERASPGADWETCWRLARLSGLGPDNTSFLFKLIHQILPTQERISRTKPNSSPNCKAQGCQGQIESLEHALINCHANQGVGVQLLEFVQGLAPTPDAQALLRLEVHAEEDLELPLVWLIATIFQSMRKLRETKNKVEPYLVRAELEAKVNM